MSPGRVLALGVLAVTVACSVSPRDEQQRGGEVAAAVDSQLPMLRDTVVAQFVTTLGRSLTSGTAGENTNWRFTVVNIALVNAAALPGGYVYVTRGLIEQSDSLDELAGVMAHEIGHVIRHHSAKQMKEEDKRKAGLIVLCTLTRVCTSVGGVVAVKVGAEAQEAQYSQRHESEADSVAVLITRGAGIDPEGLPQFLQKVLEERARRPSALEAFFSSHPTDEARIAALHRQIAALGPPGQTLIRSTPEFGVVRDRVRALPPPPTPFDTLGAPKRR